MYTAVFIAITNISDIIGFIKQKLSNRIGSDVEAESSQTQNPTEDFPIAAFIQVVVLYYQVASMLKMKYQGQKQGEQHQDSSINDIREFFSKLFNFRFVLYQGVCPSDDLTLPQKEAILFGMKLTTFIILIILIGVHAIIIYISNKVRHTDDDSRSTTTEIPIDTLSTDRNSPPQPVESTIDFGHRIKLTYIKLLKLYFTPVTQSALKMIHCVKLEDTLHLFVYGSMVCYNKWQLLIITVLLPGILLFPMCFELSLRLLKRGIVSSTTFVAAIACPYYSLVLYTKERLRRQNSNNILRSQSEEEFASRVLQGEEELFVQGDSWLGWQVVQLYRTIIINLVTIFITIPFYRLLTLAPILLGFLQHDKHRKPYKNNQLNQLQSLSSGCLLLVLLCNVLASISFMADISSVEFVNQVINICGIIEITLYAAVPLHIPVHKAWSYYKDRMRQRSE